MHKLRRSIYATDYIYMGTRAILITISNSVKIGAATAAEIFIGRDYKEISVAIGCDTFTVIDPGADSLTVDGVEHCVYANDEGMMVTGNLISLVSFYPKQIAGNFVIAGLDRNTGETVPATMTLEAADKLVTHPAYGYIQ